MLAGHLADVESVNRVKVPERPELFVFEVRRAGREPMFVVWVQRDSFTGEDEPPVTFDWIWPAAQASALDVWAAAISRAAGSPRDRTGVAHSALHHRRLICVGLIATSTGSRVKSAPAGPGQRRYCRLFG